MHPSVLLAALALVACRPTPAPPAPPAADEAPLRHPGRTPFLATRPTFVECTRNGPARPLDERHGHHRYPPEFGRDPRKNFALIEPDVEVRDASLTDGSVVDRAHAKEHVDLGLAHYVLADDHAARSCHTELDQPDQIHRHWALADHHMRSALHHARVVWPRRDLLDAPTSARLRCLGTLAATRLGELDAALVASRSLTDQTCAATALAWLGDALDRRGRPVEARAVFERILTIDFDDDFDHVCPVLPQRLSVDITMRAGPDPFDSDCGWRWYARYRLVLLGLRTGTLDITAAIAALAVIADQNVRYSWGYTLHAAIRADIAALRTPP